MRRINASHLAPEAPALLDALLIHERAADGPTVRLGAVGDVGFSGRVTERLAEKLADQPADQDPFREVAPVLRAADLAFANLETPLVDEPRGRLFAAPLAAAPLLAGAGFDLINLANNHILDHGRDALEATRQALSELRIEVLGAGADARDAQRLVTRDIRGLRLGFLGCARTRQVQDASASGFWEYNPRVLEVAIRESRSAVDVLVVSIHMGYMFLDYPDPEQRRQVLALLEAGADLVLLHHAHVTQGVEVTEGGGVACYNLGNFLFDWREGTTHADENVWEQRSGALFLFDLDRQGVARASALPIHVDDDWTVRWATGEAGRKVLDRLERLSDWNHETDELFHRQRAERNTGPVLSSVLRALRRGEVRAVLELVPRLRPKHLKMAGRWLAGMGR